MRLLFHTACLSLSPFLSGITRKSLVFAMIAIFLKGIFVAL
jgi:hypothetical protein